MSERAGKISEVYREFQEQERHILKHGVLDQALLEGLDWVMQYNYAWRIAICQPKVPCTMPRKEMEKLLFPLVGTKNASELPLILRALYGELVSEREDAREKLWLQREFVVW